MTIFALLIAILLSFFSYEMISYFQRKTAIQATEFNLQLISHIIDQDLLNLYALAMVCSTNSSTNTLLANYFESPQASAKDAVDVFTAMQEAFRVNPSNAYARRLIVTDHKGKFIQVDNAGGLSSSLNVHNIDKLTGLTQDAAEAWGRVVRDPLSSSDGIPIVWPIYGTGASRIGTVYLLANTSVVTDKLKGYALPANSRLLLRLGDTPYEIMDGKVAPVSTDFKERAYQKDSPTGAQTVLSVIESGAEEKIAVSYPVREGVILTQTLSDKQLAKIFNIWIFIAISVCFLVIILSGIITLYLTRTISLPVEKLKKRMDKIAQGYFTVDRNIEWNSELGDVGRGINRLSQDIVVLMESRVADVKQKQELEYRMLQNQISPHFLYNTLNSVKWMATIQNATGIAEMVTSLSRLLRSISKDIRKVVQLKDELDLLGDYFIIQKYRYGSTITMEMKVPDEALLMAPIPRFSLQPLVENAIFHGVEPKGRGHITVSVVQCESKDILITIEDNGVGMPDEQISSILSDEAVEGNGLLKNIGLRSVNERLRLAFGDKYGLSIESKLGVYTRMSILVPFPTKE
ncbi:sensor histidine kinase [Paenibacillus sp. FSL H8-0548]|uniref:sensor histidine kinase n=1 Tax=Paenibacillus sp. FSL H8-0548 TaxID=1920422 RepID=UPI002116A495|nr:sensor histidine kinase [Paenibacillus sp. FSL H8-0548]